LVRSLPGPGTQYLLNHSPSICPASEVMLGDCLLSSSYTDGARRMLFVQALSSESVPESSSSREAVLSPMLCVYPVTENSYSDFAKLNCNFHFFPPIPFLA